ncbi:hypothetical protein LY76DRAFT_224106 [Colletotrichum caudatum]|nr:hypothetical protein LY76DRAFT_224106 [Colletotrichum caudatum]
MQSRPRYCFLFVSIFVRSKLFCFPLGEGISDIVAPDDSDPCRAASTLCLHRQARHSGVHIVKNSRAAVETAGILNRTTSLGRILLRSPSSRGQAFLADWTNVHPLPPFPDQPCTRYVGLRCRRVLRAQLTHASRV